MTVAFLAGDVTPWLVVDIANGLPPDATMYVEQPVFR
jgi:hypothetical protein